MANSERDRLFNEAVTLVGMLRSFVLCGEDMDEESRTRVSNFLGDVKAAEPSQPEGMERSK